MPDAHTVSIPASGVTLHGRWVGGDGAEVFVLLPGLGFHSFEYERLQALLARGNKSSLALDYRGHGRSGGRRGDWTIPLLVSDARAAVDWVLKQRGGPLILFGNSLGGMVAIATGNSDCRVSAVAASNCPAYVGDFLLTPLRRVLFLIAKAIAIVFPLRISVNHFYSYAQLIDDSEVLERIAHDRVIREARRLSIATYRTLLEEWDGEREVARLTKPLLLVQGSRDRLQPPGQTDLLFAAANEPKRRVHLDVGHLPNLERPDLLAKALLEWVVDLALGA